MPIRSLNGLDYSVRSLNGLSDRIDYSVSLPLTIDSDYNIKLSNLTSYGTANQILKMNSGGTALEFTNETDTTYTGGTNISINGTAINLDTNLTNLSLINTFKIGGNATSEITLLTNNGNLFNGDYLKINSAGKVIGQNTKDTKNNIIGSDNTSGILVGSNMSKTVDTINGNITLNSTNTTYTGGTNISISGTAINLDSNITLDRLNMTQAGDSSSGKPIYFKGSNDVNHYIKYVYDGVEIGGYGSGNAPCFSVVNTQPLNNSPVGTPISVFQVYIDKVISKQDLNMTSKPIYFKDNDTNHYIKYQSTGDCVELASYSDGTDDDVVFQFINKSVSSGDPNLLLINKENNSFVKTTNFQSDIIIKNAKKIIFNDSTVVAQSNYIKFNDTYDSMEISGSGLGGTASVLRIVSPNATPDVLADFEITKTTFSKPTTFNSNVLIDTNLTITNDLFVNDIASVVNIDASGEITCNRITSSDRIVCDYLTVVEDIGCSAIDCEAVTSEFITVSDDVRIGKKLHMRDNTSLGEINMADGRIYFRNGYKTGENTFATDLNHFSTYSNSPVDGVRIQGWNGVALGYTDGGPGTALYTNGSGVYFGNGSAVSSDDRIKFNETRIINALSTINKLVVVEYDKKYNRELYETQYGEEMEQHLLNDTAKKEYGYIAQDSWNNIPELRFTINGVDTSIPENFNEEGLLIEDCKIRTTNSEGEEYIDRKYLSIDYNNINVLNVRAVQELSQKVKQLEEQINILINQINI